MCALLPPASKNRPARRRGALAPFLILMATSTCAWMPTVSEDDHAARRLEMVRRQIEARGIASEAVLRAMRTVPRHLFVPEPVRAEAYGDFPLPIGYRQTISQPYIVALMSEVIDLESHERVLEIGTGSGYQAAVLSELAAEVYSIEIVPELAERSRADLERLGYDNVHVRYGDGFEGWPEEAPFDAVILTASPPEIPQPLLDQLAVGGRLVAPVGRFDQELVLVSREASGVERRSLIPVRFVPMTGRAQR